MTDNKFNDDFEHQPFLPESIGNTCKHREKSFRRSIFLGHVVLIATYTTIFVLLLVKIKRSHKGIHEIPVNYTLAAESRFAGPRTDDTDRAWSELLQGINVRAEKDELITTSATPVELPQGGLLAWPEAMHQLHCVKRIREWFYRDQYLPALDERLEEHWKVHIDHCIELIRQSVMCNPDKAWMGFHWEDGNDRPTLNLRGPEHTCVDWNQYASNIKTRSISHKEMSQLGRS